MNATRRNSLQGVLSLLDRVSNILEGVRDQEEDSLENMPDNLKESERCINMESTIDDLDDIISQIDAAGDSIRDLV